MHNEDLRRMQTIREVHYESWRQLKGELISDLFGNSTFRGGKYIFRGHADSDWKLVSSFDRWYSAHTFLLARHEAAERMLDQFKRWLGERYLSRQFPDGDNALLGLAQHYGLPTRLLDWSDSPYVAAFFAFVNRLEQAHTGSPRIALWALNREAGVWHPELGVNLIRPPSFRNVRLRNQAGCFTINRTPVASLEEYVEIVKPKCEVFVKIEVDADAASEAMADLAAMGITAATVFPGIQGAALAARLQFVLDNV